MKRVTCRDLALKLGLSQPAVSMALRDHPSLPLKTRERVKAMAREMGYRPDPVLSALNAYRQSKQGVNFQATLGCINRANTGFGHTAFEDFFAGAKDLAWKLGFHLEEFSVATEEDWQGLPKILKSRGIEGLLIPPIYVGVKEISPVSFPWGDFFAVSVGQVVGLPFFHLVINDQYHSSVLVVRELHALGYKRIGMMMPDRFARLTNRRFLGGYLSECSRLGLPDLSLIEASETEEQSQDNTIKWIRKQRLDVVITPGDGDILPALQKAKLQVPRDLAVAFLARMAALPDYAHMDQNDRQIGRASVNHLIDLIRRNERGIPAIPVHHLIPGKWIAGFSAPGRKVAAGPSQGGIAKAELPPCSSI